MVYSVRPHVAQMGACHVRVVQVHDFGLKSFCGIPGIPLIVSSMVDCFSQPATFRVLICPRELSVSS